MLLMGDDIKTGKAQVPITVLQYIGWVKIKTNGTQTDVISH